MHLLLRPPCFAFALLIPVAVPAQQPVAPSATDLSAALTGRWTGVLEYRDYKEPASSLKRVALPTWLSINAAAPSGQWHYIYDDGPGKVVDSDEEVAFDPSQERCTVTPKGKAPQSYKVAGYDSLKSGRGTLLLTGAGTDNSKPSEMRLTLTVGRNLFSLLEEVRPAGTQDAFAYRHLYRFVRAEAPVVTK